MTTEFFALSEDATAQEAIRRLQLATDAEMVFYIYVTDKDERLVGVLSLRQLLTVPPTTPLKNIATRDVISVTVDMDQEEVARQVASYNLLAIPVIDNDNRLVGIITVDDVVDVIREEATEDMLKMAGAIEEDSVSKSSSVASAKHRLAVALYESCRQLCCPARFCGSSGTRFRKSSPSSVLSRSSPRWVGMWASSLRPSLFEDWRQG